MKKFALIFTLLIITYSCGGDSDEPSTPPNNNPPPTTPVTYNQNIRPIVSITCATSGCHTGANPAPGFALDTYAQVKEAAMNRPLYTRIQSSTNPMPPTGRMSTTNINLFLAWRDQGYPEN